MNLEKFEFYAIAKSETIAIKGGLTNPTSVSRTASGSTKTEGASIITEPDPIIIVSETE